MNIMPVYSVAGPYPVVYYVCETSAPNFRS